MKRFPLPLSGLMVLLILAGCASSGNIPVRHLETGVNTEFNYEGMDFADYMKYSRNIILKYRTDITPESKARILEANSPFELQPGAACPRGPNGKPERGILLIHGLSDSPFTMRDLASHFQSRCFLVRGILHPGHGTVPGDLLSVSYEAWIKAARYGVRGLSSEVSKIYVGGFSTGGALAVQATFAGEHVDGLLLFAPAIGLRSKLAFMANWHKPVSWFKPGLKWVDVAADLDYAKYESFPMNAADQIHLLTKKVDEQQWGNKTIGIPIFMAASL